MRAEPDPSSEDPDPEDLSWSTRIVAAFLQGPLPILIVVVSLLAGALALVVTPREEEPQIVVPLADVHVSAPGLGAEQVERQVTSRLEKLLYQIDGVEYVYSQSRAGGCTVTVRFYVGEDREESLLKLHDQVTSNVDLVTPAIDSWVIKPIEIDDVPIVVASLWSDDPALYGHAELHRMAEELELRLQATPGTNRVDVIGGPPREVRVELDAEALAARRIAPLDVVAALGATSYLGQAGTAVGVDRSVLVEVGGLLRDADDVRALVVKVVDGVPVHLREVAAVIDGPAEAVDLTWIGFGPADGGEGGEARGRELRPAVHIAIGKKKGTNAVSVARRSLAALAQLEATVLPPEVHVEVIRDQGRTAKEKVDELVEALGVAMLTVVLFIGVVLGWRSAFVIALAIPVCYGATLLINYLAGYTINRVTLFALILSLGLLVDDPITDVENIERYFRRGRLSPRRAVLRAVAEVRPALVMSTLTIILSFVPLVFITGMMGPYMEPMALNVPLTVTISTLVAFCVTPYLALRALRGIHGKSGPEGPEGHGESGDVAGTVRYRLYDRMLRPLLRRRAATWAVLALVALLFVGSLVLPALRAVPLKMLPYDNKNELQLVVDLDEGATLERTDAVVRDLATYLLGVPEVQSVATFAGLPSPIDFNGMVRHYYLRHASHLGELRVQLAHKDERAQDSHALALRLRDDLTGVASRHGAKLAIVEVPPGPPVISTITAEVRGDADADYADLEAAALVLAARLGREPGVVDVDTTVEFPQSRSIHRVDAEKAALSGVSTVEVAETITLALSGAYGATLEDPDDVEPTPIVVTLPRAVRGDPATLAALQVIGRPGIVKERDGAALRDAPQPMVPLAELADVVEVPRDSTIHHKNLERVVYVFAEVAGRAPADIVLDVGADRVEPDELSRGAEGAAAAPTAPRPLAARTHLAPGGGDRWSIPAATNVRWNGEGEWKITLDVFRDLGIAFAAANLAIFFVLWLQTGSVIVTLILMAAIPLTMIGIMPGFWLLSSLSVPVGGFDNPTYFTATAMIGMIALSGIVVRNSLVLVEFVQEARAEGFALEEALVRSGAIRVRPILLTAGTTFLGNIVITLDPVFSGLAWAVIFGIFASTLFSLVVVPLIYNLVFGTREVIA